MAVKYIYRKNFPVLATGAFIILQPLLSGSAAAQQFDCKAGPAGGWSCVPKETQTQRPPRPETPSSKVATHSSAAEQTQRTVKAPIKKSTAQQTATASVAQNKGKALAQRSSDYSHLDWVPREQLSEQQLAEIGPYCSGRYVEPLRPGMDDDTAFKDAPLYINAGASRYEQLTETATIAGDVIMRQASLQIEADEASLHQQDNVGELKGNVRIRDRNALMVGDRAELVLDSGEAQVENAEYIMHSGQVRGSALYVKRNEDAIIRLKDGTYTSCEPGSNAWHLKGNNVTLNPNTGFGSATNVTLRVKDIPVFYTPYIHFPIDDRRVSGFLPPSVSYSRKKGVNLTTPYYFNLAPNFDATLYPNYMSKRGLLTEGEFRYLGKKSETFVGGAWLSDSEDERKLQSEYEKDRWMYTLQHEYGFNSRLLGQIDYTDISDPYYFQDLDSNIAQGSNETLDQKASLTWRGNSYSARLGVHAYEMANITDITPYDRLPEFSLIGALPYQPAGLRMSYKTEWTRFDRSLRKKGETTINNLPLKQGNYSDKDGVYSFWNDARLQGLDRANGDRLHIEPELSLPMNWSWGFLKPSIKYAYTRYDLSLDSQGKQDFANKKFSSNPDRSLGIYSIDSGLYFDRNTQLFGKNYRQTLEPRLYYLYVPYEDQSDLPLFDTSEIQFSYASLFRDNRFSGHDRIGDTNQISLGLTNRWIEDNGMERQRISVGQAYYLADRKVLLSGKDYKNVAANTANRSPYALDYMYRFNRDWSINADLMWDPDTHRTRSGSAIFHYQPVDNLNKIVNFGYRYRNDSTHYNYDTGRWETGSADYIDTVTKKVYKDFYKIEQTDASFMWPVVNHWNLIGRWQYDYNRNSTLEAFGGFEYDSCCWKLRLINRYWVDYDERNMRPQDNRKGDHGVFLQIVLKGLGGVTGNKVETFLDEGIHGYRKREDNAY
ncbi:LPS-assembly protein LptD [Denitrificimonas sp. JX-1]|uniref:LPS-assembly protein LptD n=1 Tax=Denitrificimonas halotolerans TaxID=3098930 RepID=A0ABU5GSD8_9GAMM|nr:LPS-assembly protein LptD [Denitrificimonas sp. JX-1]MDY7219907.1 LPS-assembly protein LptD [Denitrificimonas sp. JX-1]